MFVNLTSNYLEKKNICYEEREFYENDETFTSSFSINVLHHRCFKIIWYQISEQIAHSKTSVDCFWIAHLPKNIYNGVLYCKRRRVPLVNITENLYAFSTVRILISKLIMKTKTWSSSNTKYNLIFIMLFHNNINKTHSREPRKKNILKKYTEL